MSEGRTSVVYTFSLGISPADLNLYYEDPYELY